MRNPPEAPVYNIGAEKTAGPTHRQLLAGLLALLQKS
jgi:hypothetical protein